MLTPVAVDVDLWLGFEHLLLKDKIVQIVMMTNVVVPRYSCRRHRGRAEEVLGRLDTITHQICQ